MAWPESSEFESQAGVAHPEAVVVGFGAAAGPIRADAYDGSQTDVREYLTADGKNPYREWCATHAPVARWRQVHPDGRGGPGPFEAGKADS